LRAQKRGAARSSVFIFMNDIGMTERIDDLFTLRGCSLVQCRKSVEV
jgi:hypothetical protein